MQQTTPMQEQQMHHYLIFRLNEIEKQNNPSYWEELTNLSLCNGEAFTNKEYNEFEFKQINQRIQRLINEAFDQPQLGQPTSISNDIDISLANRAPANYNLQEQIHKIKSQPQRLHCLFIGRLAKERIPLSHGNELWASLDYFYNDTRMSNSGVAANLEELKDRIHLVIDFNNEAEVAQIQHLFDRVVVDIGVMNWFTKDNAWVTLKGMLHPKPTSELIVPSPSWHLSEGDPQRQARFFQRCTEAQNHFHTVVASIFPYETKQMDGDERIDPKKIDCLVANNPRK